MEFDADDVGAWLARWWVEAALTLVVLGGVASGLRRGDVVRVALGVALGAAVVDRLRLRLDNRSLAVAVGEIREAGVSTARRSTPGDDAPDAGAGAGASPRPSTTPSPTPGPSERASTGAGAVAAADDGGDGSDDARETLDREAVADLLGEPDPENVTADDIAALVERAESNAGVDLGEASDGEGDETDDEADDERRGE